MGSESSSPHNLTNFNGTLFFSAWDGINDRELWSSNGTAAGTNIVKDLAPRGLFSGLRHLTNVNGKLFFSADDGIHGQELWSSNGTSSGTNIVKDIFPGSRYSNPYLLANVNGTLFFTATDGVSGFELWAIPNPMPTDIIAQTKTIDMV